MMIGMTEDKNMPKGCLIAILISGLFGIFCLGRGLIREDKKAGEEAVLEIASIVQKEYKRGYSDGIDFSMRCAVQAGVAEYNVTNPTNLPMINFVSNICTECKERI